jgi:cytochrome b561
MKSNLGIAFVIFTLFLVGYEPALTGSYVHEWLNLTFAFAILVHLAMHWDWLAAVARRLVRRTPPAVRFNYILGLLLLIVFVMMILSGLMISRSALAAFGYVPPQRSVWRELHSAFSNIWLFLIALHIAMHWDWIAHACRRYLAAPRRNGARAVDSQSLPPNS